MSVRFDAAPEPPSGATTERGTDGAGAAGAAGTTGVVAARPEEGAAEVHGRKRPLYAKLELLLDLIFRWVLLLVRIEGRVSAPGGGGRATGAWCQWLDGRRGAFECTTLACCD